MIYGRLPVPASRPKWQIFGNQGTQPRYFTGVLFISKPCRFSNLKERYFSSKRLGKNNQPFLKQSCYSVTNDGICSYSRWSFMFQDGQADF